ncbi:hypothetical protein GCM10009616_15230 [Microlunatus lacustris]
MSSPEELSAARVPAPREAPLPFGLTWADLGRGLPGAAAGGRAAVSHVKRGQHQGGHPSVILTLSYDAADGQPRRQTVFFKMNPHESREARRHQFLADRGIPVPQLVVCVERGCEEVLGLEFLPSVGLGPGDVDEVLRLVAALNSTTDVPEAIARTPPGLPQAQFEHVLGQALDEISAVHPDLGAPTWLDTYRRAAVRYRDLPTALTHGELAAQHVGRTESGRLVILDLATAGRRPRLADLANLLTPSTALAGLTERSVLRDYLRHLSPTSRLTGPEDQAWAELQLTRFVQAVEALPWRLGLRRPAELRRHLHQIASDQPAVLDQVDRDRPPGGVRI